MILPVCPSTRMSVLSCRVTTVQAAERPVAQTATGSTPAIASRASAAGRKGTRKSPSICSRVSLCLWICQAGWRSSRRSAASVRGSPWTMVASKIGCKGEDGRRFPFETVTSTKEGPTPVAYRVCPTDRVHAKIDALFAEDRPLPEILEEVARLGAQLLMQAALEAEVTEFLGRDRYQRAALTQDARPGSRNGYRDVSVKTTAGPVELARPKLRGTTEVFASRLFGSHVTKTNALESLVIASFVRGLSVRDVEATLAEALGDQPGISKYAVSALCQQIKEEYQAWARRCLDDVTLDYLFLDASFFRMHPASPAEPVLAAWGITTGGKPAFIGLAPGAGESADAWHDFLADLRDRGLASPLLVISDGNQGLIGAIEQVFPQALRQRCLIHRARNIVAKVRPGCRPKSRTPTGRSSTPTT